MRSSAQMACCEMTSYDSSEDEITTLVTDEFSKEVDLSIDEKDILELDQSKANNMSNAVEEVSNVDFINSLKSTGVGLNTLTNMIAEQFNERNVPMISGIVNCIGKEHSIQLAQDTMRVEEGGGMLTEDGMRRSPGGVFLKLVESRRYLSKLEKEQAKEEIRKVNRIGKQGKKNKKRRLKLKELKKRLNSNDLIKELM